VEYAMKLDRRMTGTFTYKFGRDIYKISVEKIMYIEYEDKVNRIFKCGPVGD
jgi:DNA-binding LytR/AlgR family response regulator